MEPAGELWNCLRRVRSLHFIAQSTASTGWNGTGRGDVVVEAHAETVLTLKESGAWRPLNGRELRFTNVFRWSVINTSLVRLEHLRFGPENPVYLFDLAPKEQGRWLSVGPHVCREDCYSAELRLQEDGMFLHWVIAGPKKQESIEYDYRV